MKQHLGIAGGYDNGIAHGSVGYYLTVAEWGRWNFGVPSIEIGIGRYPVDRPPVEAVDHEGAGDVHGQPHARRTTASATSRAWGLNCYLNLEQVFDLHANRTGSQFGLSFSTK